jgi:hypothetical protein
MKAFWAECDPLMEKVENSTLPVPDYRTWHSNQPDKSSIFEHLRWKFHLVKNNI